MTETTADQRPEWEQVLDAIREHGGENLRAGERALAGMIGALAGVDTHGGVTVSAAQLSLAVGYAKFLEGFVDAARALADAIEGNSRVDMNQHRSKVAPIARKWVEVVPVTDTPGVTFAVMAATAEHGWHDVEAYATREEAVAAALSWRLPVRYVRDSVMLRDGG